MRRGGKRAVEVSKITSLTWGDMAVRGSRTAWIHLTGDGEPLKISCNESGLSNDRREFLKLASAICEAVEAQQSDVTVRIDGGVGFSMAMFVIGVLGVLAGVGFAISGAMDWVKRDAGLAIIGGLVGAAVMGLLARAYAPWRQARDVPIGELKDLVAELIMSGS